MAVLTIDLVKVFLFKPGHIDKYKALGYPTPNVHRKDFMKLAKKSLTYLYDEIELANPKAIILLGTEVIRTVLNVSDKKAKELMKPETVQKKIRGEDYTFFALPHPGIVMRNSEAGKAYKKKLIDRSKLCLVNIKPMFLAI